MDDTGGTSRGWQARTRAAAVAERSEATRTALLVTARRLFVEKGYSATGIDEIATAAGVGTKGALYHHFSSKRALFQAVFEEVENDLLAAADGAPPEGALAQLRAGLLGFLDAAVERRDVQQVILIDGPAVLGWRTWRALEERYGLGVIKALLSEAVKEGAVPPQPVDALAHVLLAALDGAALYIANAPEPSVAKDDAVEVMSTLLRGISA